MNSKIILMERKMTEIAIEEVYPTEPTLYSVVADTAHVFDISAATDGTQVLVLYGLNEPSKDEIQFETGLRSGVNIHVNADNHEEILDFRNVEIIQGASDDVSLTLTMRPFFANNADRQYLLTAQDIIARGKASENRTIVNTSKLFGTQLRFDLREGYPLLTSKLLNTGAILKELCWFLRGETNIKTLGSKIWDEWAAPNGELGPVYGAKWRGWTCWHQVNLDHQRERVEFLESQGYYLSQKVEEWGMFCKRVDQLQDIVDEINNNPNNRRMLVTAWNPADNPDTKFSPAENAEFGMQALPPCHTFWQVACADMTLEERRAWYIAYGDNPIAVNADTHETLDHAGVPRHFLDLHLYQRSADWFLGVPFNIASYAALTELLALHTNKVARDFIHSFGDYHIYDNHVEQINTQLATRETYKLPKLVIHRKHDDIGKYVFEDFEVVGYQHGAKLTGEVAV